jgi:hypothetical protein
MKGTRYYFFTAFRWAAQAAAKIKISLFHFFTRQNWVSIRVFALGPVKGIFNVTRIPARNAASAVSHHRCYDTNFGDKIQNMACSLAKRHITTAPLLNETLEWGYLLSYWRELKGQGKKWLKTNSLRFSVSQ